MSKPKVFLTGGDGIGWAVDEDLKLCKESIEPIVDLVDLAACDVVHCAWWEGLMMIPTEQLVGKVVICQVPGEPFRYFTMPNHCRALPMVSHWITRTTQASSQMTGLGVPNTMIPYLIDVTTFKPLAPDDPSLEALRAEWDLRRDACLIGSFQRDTEGSDLRTPKRVKGPDLLLDVVKTLLRRGRRVHLVLAGPRRHWIVQRAAELGIPFTYVGKQVEADDIDTNTLPRPTLNLLYNLIDLYLVTSRSEGGPHAILEAAASRCKVVSSAVGMAPDVLEPSCVFRSCADAVEIVEQDIRGDTLADTVGPHYERVQRNHRPESVRPLFENLYRDVGSIARFPADLAAEMTRTRSSYAGTSSARRLTVGLWHTFFKPPYGGGNQFMLALRKGLLDFQVDVRQNELHEGIDAYVLNSIHFDVNQFLSFRARHRINVIHRIDGPIHLIRGYDREKDELCYDLNAKFASATVLQSAWVYQRIVEMGYRPVNPVIIHNAVDPDIFHNRGRISFDPGRKIRLIATSWSNNPRKGGPVYRWIEEHLDWDRFEFTFVGNVSEPLGKARHLPPVSSEELAAILREHDVYITASRNDPCSNALIEALACGLPALYFNDGGHPELVGQGGLPFSEKDEIFPQLEKLVSHYEMLQNAIVVSQLSDVAGRYLALIRDVVGQ